jgi:subtilisin family serine protease
MKKNFYSLAIKAAFVFSGFFIAGAGFSQTVYNDYQDGKIWFQLKGDKPVYHEISVDGKTKPDLNHLKLSTMPFLRDVFTSHSVTNLSQPFPRAYGSDELLRTYLVEFADINNVESFISQLEESGAVVYAEKVPLDNVSLTPNDPMFNSSQMWGLFQINAQNAWNVGTGSSSIVVATTDNAIQITHPDLVNAIWINTGEIPNNGIDDDGNGYIDDVNGYDVGDNDNNPNPPSNSFSHGTHVAGTTGAQSNNSIGVASIGYGISIMPVKSTRNSAGSNSITNGYDGIYYAAVNNADVINCSWGGTGYSTTGQNIVNFAWNNGSIVVAAAGNDGTNNDSSPHYPSNLNNVISVASTTTGDVKSSFSNYGNTVDISAPGSNIRSTVPTNNYASMSGTSMATPMVSGLLGLMKSLNPTMPNQDLINCMYNTAVNINSQNPSYANKLGAGRIDAFAAMNCVAATLNNPPVAQFSANYTTIVAGGSVTFTDLSTFGPTTWAWNFNNLNVNPGSVIPATASTKGPHTVTYNTVGVYQVRLFVTNPNGNDAEVKTAYINVVSPGACNELNLDDNNFTSQSSIHVGWTPSVFTVASPGGGFVSGLNSTGDKAKVEYFPASMVGSNTQFVTGVYIWFNNAYSSNPNKTININVYNATGGTPGAILATRTITMGSLTNGAIRFYQFATPVPLPASSQIAVGVDFSNLSYPSDSLSIVTSGNGNPSNSIGFEKRSTNAWNAYSARWTGITNLSHYIFPQLTANPVNVNLTANPTTICAGDQVNYDATGSTFQDTLLWTFVGQTPINSNNVITNKIYNTAGSYKTYLEVVGGGCGNYAIDSVTITVNPTPNISITTTADTVCNTGNVTLTCVPAQTSYLWTPGGQTTQARTATITGNTTFNVTATTAGCSDNASITIYHETSPTAASIATPSTPVCTGTLVNFDGTSSAGANTFNWTFPQGSPSIGSSTNPFASVSFGAGGTHNYSLQVTNMCGSNTFNGTVVVNAGPNNTTTLAVGSITSNEAAATSYQWVDCNNSYAIISGATNQVFNPTVSGDYAVVIVKNGCTDTSACVNYLITGVNELSSNSISIYPNPTNNKITVDFGNTTVSKITLFDVQGKVVYDNSVINNNKLSIDLVNANKGVYFLQVVVNETVSTYKVIKQ